MSKIQAGKLLSRINSPKDLKQLDVLELPKVSEELRRFIIEVVSENGGHFGGNLGVVELTVALHYVFDAPKDLIVWDVGHQAYGHKILTGRRDVFHTNRKYKGISGFPKRSESKYDTFGVGHSSTSISAALGMAIANKHLGKEDRHVVAVIGDGAMTAGLAFEALNHAGFEKANLLVILNDNNMSIDPNVGALKEYLTDIRTSRTYNKIREEVWKMLGKLDKLSPKARKLAAKLESSLLTTMKPGVFFETLGFNYFGPIDGHDVLHLVEVLEDLKKIPGPKLLHCVTVKGKGFAPAEQNQTAWHAASSKFHIHTGEKIEKEVHKEPSPLKYQEVFGKTLIELAEQNPKIVAITPAMISGHGLTEMQEKMPDRVYDVGIAEQHAVTFSAGLATQGIIPFCCIYSTFAQRAYDQIIHDVALQKLPVIFSFDRAGLVGADGPTHHGAFDLAYLRPIPNMIISAPMNESELRNLMLTATETKLPFVIRYPRGKGVQIHWKTPMEKIPVGKGRKITDGENIAVLTLGHPGNFAREAIKELNKIGIYPAHYDIRFLKPIDKALLTEVFENFENVITVEDGAIIGGLGSAVIEFMNDNNFSAKVIRLGIPDRFIEHGTQAELHRECGYDARAIYETVLKLVEVNA